jgi:hypothetical protein
LSSFFSHPGSAKHEVTAALLPIRITLIRVGITPVGMAHRIRAATTRMPGRMIIIRIIVDATVNQKSIMISGKLVSLIKAME